MEKKSGDRIAETWTSFSVIRRSKGWKIKVKICLPILFHAQNHLTRPVKEWKRFGFVCDRTDKKSFRLMLFFFYFQLTALKKHTIPNPRHTKVSFLLKVNVIKQLDNNVPNKHHSNDRKQCICDRLFLVMDKYKIIISVVWYLVFTEDSHGTITTCKVKVSWLTEVTQWALAGMCSTNLPLLIKLDNPLLFP